MSITHFLRYSLRLLFALLLLGVSIQSALALNHETPQSEFTLTKTSLTVDSINAELLKLKTDTRISSTSKKNIKQLYQTALTQLQAASVFDATAHSYQQLIEDGDKNTKKIKHQLKKLLSRSNKLNVSATDELAITRLEHQLKADKAKLLVLENNLDDLNQRLQQQIARPRQIHLAQQTLANKLIELAKQLNNLSPQNAGTYSAYNPELLVLKAKRQASQAENHMHVIELNSHSLRLELLRGRYDYAIAEIASIRARIERVENFLIEHRETQVSRFSREMAEALQAAAGKHPVILDAIRENLNLSDEYRTISQAITTASAQRQQVDQQNEQVSNQAKKAERMFALADISPKLVSLLRKQRHAIFDYLNTAKLADSQLRQSGEASVRQFEIEERIKALKDVNKAVDDKLTTHIIQPDSEHDDMSTRVELQLLLNQQSTQFEKINQVYTDYIGILEALGFSSKKLAKTSHLYKNKLDKNLLWVKSAAPVTTDFVSELGDALAWLLSTEQWNKVLASVYPAASQQLIRTILILLLILGLLLARPTIQKRLQIITKKVSFGYSDSFYYTLENMLLIILQVLPLVIAIYFVGWLLMTADVYSEFGQAFGRGLMSASISLFFLQSFYYFFAPNGIAAKQLKWPESSSAILHRQIKWLRYVAILCAFLIAVSNHQSIVSYSASLGRLFLIVLLIAISIVLSITLHPETGILKLYLQKNQQSILAKTRYLWYPIVVIAPLAIGVFAVFGYVVSALELEQRMVASIRLILIAVIIHELALRGLRLFNRNLAIKKYLGKQRADKTTQISGEVGETTLPIDPDELDIATINKQTRRLLWLTVVATCLFSFWLVWKDLLPALGVLDDLQLWEKSVLVNDVSTLLPVTLANLLRALFYIVIIIVAIKNLPGVLEVLILNRLSMEAGSRFAVIQLINYSLIALTIIVVTSELGWQWSQVQWLVAALSVGLGFGLQEIFANFISGIILLFERPIRIGDTVTVGNVTGTVSRIQIRATTVTDWDRKDLVVPNKNFITNQLVNWTRTDNITRIVITVGIAYGSDTKLAHQVITDILKAHPLVLSDPQPMVFFIGFGDSSLDFEIRLFVKDVINRLPLTHDIHMNIDDEFKKHGIEIPFPQRDIHVRSVEPQQLTNPGSDEIS
jgi:potassium efflux system protein